MRRKAKLRKPPLNLLKMILIRRREYNLTATQRKNTMRRMISKMKLLKLALIKLREKTKVKSHQRHLTVLGYLSLQIWAKS